jgi:hypothetical protein
MLTINGSPAGVGIINKRSQLFIRTHNQTLSVVAMRVGNPDRSRVRINR